MAVGARGTTVRSTRSQKLGLRKLGHCLVRGAIDISLQILQLRMRLLQRWLAVSGSRPIAAFAPRLDRGRLAAAISSKIRTHYVGRTVQSNRIGLYFMLGTKDCVQGREIGPICSSEYPDNLNCVLPPSVFHSPSSPSISLLVVD